MTTFNKTLSFEQAQELLSFKGEINYPDTEHNRIMIAKAMHVFLSKLHGK